MIKLQILLHEPRRTSEDIERVRELIESMGIEPTSSGSATLSAEITDDLFQELFNVPVTKVSSRAPANRDFGRSGGSVSDDLIVPEPLRKYVESITVVSPYLRM
jgi:hypothetical protein